MHYFICGYCGNSRKSLFMSKFRPKCNCKGGNGKTFMSRSAKISYINNNKNQKNVKKEAKEFQKNNFLANIKEEK